MTWHAIIWGYELCTALTSCSSFSAFGHAYGMIRFARYMAWYTPARSTVPFSASYLIGGRDCDRSVGCYVLQRRVYPWVLVRASFSSNRTLGPVLLFAIGCLIPVGFRAMGYVLIWYDMRPARRERLLMWSICSLLHTAACVFRVIVWGRFSSKRTLGLFFYDHRLLMGF